MRKVYSSLSFRPTLAPLAISKLNIQMKKAQMESGWAEYNATTVVGSSLTKCAFFMETLLILLPRLAFGLA